MPRHVKTPSRPCFHVCVPTSFTHKLCDWMSRRVTLGFYQVTVDGVVTQCGSGSP
jgi:hypothetical protein